MNPEIKAYIDNIKPKFRYSYEQLLDLMILNIPSDFELVMQYNMPSFVVPKSLYPPGYHVAPSLPLPFLALGVQNIILEYITWVFMQMRTYFTGLKKTMQHKFPQNWILVNLAFDLKIRKISPLIYLPNFLRKCQHKSGSQLIKKKSHHSSDGISFLD